VGWSHPEPAPPRRPAGHGPPAPGGAQPPSFRATQIWATQIWATQIWATQIWATQIWATQIWARPPSRKPRIGRRWRGRAGPVTRLTLTRGTPPVAAGCSARTRPDGTGHAQGADAAPAG
jgi:hypothetical protein